MKIYVNKDFYVRFVTNEDVSSDAITIKYENGNGTVRGIAPTSVILNIVTYVVPKANNTVTGKWSFQATVVQGGLEYDLETIYVVIHEEFN